MRIGILGGTFDPIHKGHLALAKAAFKKLKLNRVIFVPAHRHPLKTKDSTVSVPPAKRLSMVKLAIKGVPKFQVSGCELKRKGPSYTVDTLRFFKKKFPKDELFFITGGDWGRRLDLWKDIDVIFSLAHFVVAKRPGFNLKNLPREVEPLNFVPLKISSSEIRNRLKKGKLSSQIPKDVNQYIKKQKLYQ